MLGEPTLDTLAETKEIRELIARCAAGDAVASRQFQEHYGELVYGYPMRVYRVPRDEAGDFYVFAFEGGRLYRRLRTYEGRAPFQAFLVGFVLDDLVLEWKRGEREIETVSIEELGEFPTDAGSVGGSLADGDPSAMTEEGESAMDAQVLTHLLAEVEPDRGVVMKLLHVEDFELTVAEIRYVSDASSRSVQEVVTSVDRLRAMVREREAGRKSIEDHLDAAHAWVQLYGRRLRRIAEDLEVLPPSSTKAARLREEQGDLERKMERRHKQRAKLVMQMRRHKVTAPYKEIAAILNTTTGNVGSRIARLRQELQLQMQARVRQAGGPTEPPV